MQRAFFTTAAAIAVTTEATKFEYTPENQILAELDSQVGAFANPEPTLEYGIPRVLNFWTGGKTAFKPTLTDILHKNSDEYAAMKKMRSPEKKNALLEKNAKYYAPADEGTEAEDRIIDWPHHSLQFLSKYMNTKYVPCENYIDPADELMQMWMLIHLSKERAEWLDYAIPMKKYLDEEGFNHRTSTWEQKNRSDDIDIVAHFDDKKYKDVVAQTPSLMQLREARCFDEDQQFYQTPIIERQ